MLISLINFLIFPNNNIGVEDIKPIGSIKIPIFKIGEILVCDNELISIPDMRKPYKWGVEREFLKSRSEEEKREYKGIIYEVFDKVEDAIRRAREVTEQIEARTHDV